MSVIPMRRKPTPRATAIRKARRVYAIAFDLDGRGLHEDLLALHSCNNPSCVNPSHLRWGSQKENLRQAIDSGRAPHQGRVAGEKNGNAKLTSDQVAEIRSSTGNQSEVARRYGITRSLVSHIRLRRAWGHVS